MKNILKTLLKFAIVFVVCFIAIYLVVFSGGWKLFESGDPILIEIGVALVVSIFVFPFGEAFDRTATNLEKRIENLEKRIEELENKR